jgi:hypothetical protein
MKIQTSLLSFDPVVRETGTLTRKNLIVSYL